MAERSAERPAVCLEFAFDRLLTIKLQQVYGLLVANCVRPVGQASEQSGDPTPCNGDAWRNDRFRSRAGSLGKQRRRQVQPNNRTGEGEGDQAGSGANKGLLTPLRSNDGVG
jgi:hypothetical protein